MRDQDLLQMQHDLASQQDDVDFELFAVGQGVAPGLQASLQLRSDAVHARIRTVNRMLESRARAVAIPVSSVDTMSRREINAEFEALMNNIDMFKK